MVEIQVLWSKWEIIVEKRETGIDDRKPGCFWPRREGWNLSCWQAIPKPQMWAVIIIQCLKAYQHNMGSFIC